jgi:Tir chaperone protein (CesT) family
MVKDLFDALLSEIGHALKLPDLHQDRNNSCLIKMPTGIDIQMEMHPRLQEFILGSDLGEVPLGRYRENIFMEALKANGMPYPQHGVLAYSTKSGHMVLYEKFHTRDLTGQRIADEIPLFIEKAKIWKDALEKGEIPAVTGVRTSMGMFGLRP